MPRFKPSRKSLGKRQGVPCCFPNTKMETAPSNREGKSYCGRLTGVISAGQGEGYYLLITLSESKYIRKQTSPIPINIYFFPLSPFSTRQRQFVEEEYLRRYFRPAPTGTKSGASLLPPFAPSALTSENPVFEKLLSTRSRFDKRP